MSRRFLKADYRETLISFSGETMKMICADAIATIVEILTHLY